MARSTVSSQNQPWRVGVGCGATRVERAAHSRLPTRCQQKKTHSLTLLLQNHLDHLNILLLGVAGTSTRAVA